MGRNVSGTSVKRRRGCVHWWAWVLALVAAALAVAATLLGAGPASAVVAVSHYDTTTYTYDASANLSTERTTGAAVRGPPSGQGAAPRVSHVSFGRFGVAANTGSRFGSLTHSSSGIAPYSTQRMLTAGNGGSIQAHHLVEQRFADVMGQAVGDMPSIVVTQAEHQVFTNAWRAEIPYGSRNVTPTQVNGAARRIYADYPEILQALGLG